MATQKNPNWPPTHGYNQHGGLRHAVRGSKDLQVTSEFKSWLHPLISQSPNLTETQFSCTNVMMIK